MQSWMIWAAIGAGALFTIAIYNRIISLVQARKTALSDIDVQLKQRYDLVPNLVEAVKGYAAHEKGIMEAVTAARATAMSGGSVADRAKAEGALSGAMMNLMAVAENYPQLKADANFRQLQSDLSDLENKIAASRRFYNNATSEYNAAIKQFPAVLLSGMMGFHEEAFFEVDASEKQAVKDAPKVSFGS